SAPARVLIDHDFVAGNDVEQRRVQPHPARNDGFHADFGVAAAARLQIEIEAAPTATAGHLHQRRRLEASPDIAAHTRALVHRIYQTGHWRGASIRLRAAVVTV